MKPTKFTFTKAQLARRDEEILKPFLEAIEHYRNGVDAITRDAMASAWEVIAKQLDEFAASQAGAQRQLRSDHALRTVAKAAREEAAAVRAGERDPKPGT